MVDPQVRLQNIAIEASELQSRRQMCWAEASSRGSTFMNVVGATVFGLALVGNATAFNQDFLLLTLLILPVLLFAGVSSLARMAELERQDGTLVQGLNRMRQLRVQLDPTIEPYLVLSPYDDAVSLLASYGDNNPRLHTLWILETLIGAIVALIAAFLAAILAVILNVTGGTAFAVGVVTFLATAGLLAFVGVRSFASAMRSVKSVFPAPRAAEPDRSDHRESPP
jgi:hypothetical protein